MKILSNYSQYRKALKEIDPYRIAVAYIGTRLFGIHKHEEN